MATGPNGAVSNGGASVADGATDRVQAALTRAEAAQELRIRKNDEVATGAGLLIADAVGRHGHMCCESASCAGRVHPGLLLAPTTALSTY